jgi:DHA2 family methylenomycin A resistance protein-like MFS transporter
VAGPRIPAAVGLLVSVAGLALLALVGAGSAYVAILPGLVLWGLGLALVTPAVVAAALGAVAPERAGLASAVNNTARQAGGALGIAAFGAIAGAPGGSGFVAGLHECALAAAGLYLAAAGVVLVVRS